MINLNGDVDETDLKILNMLENNSRRPLREIGEELGIATSTVYERMKKMEENEVIKRYTIEKNFKKIGMNVLSFVLIKISSGNYKKVAKEIKDIDQVLEVHAASGEYDLVTKIAIKDNSSLQDIVDQVNEMNYVDSTLTMFVMNTYKG